VRENDGRKLDHRTLKALQLRAVDAVVADLGDSYLFQTAAEEVRT
jgi:hypothetical protein